MNKEDLVATALLFWDGSGSEVVFRLDDADELDVLLLSTWCCWCVSTSVECPICRVRTYPRPSNKLTTTERMIGSIKANAACISNLAEEAHE